MKLRERIERRLSVYEIQREFKIPHYRAKVIHRISDKYDDIIKLLLEYEKKRDYKEGLI
ncbi:MAG: hypothetical protein QXQ40_01720 [Candidatus Aenigmatarchaeota archaeon]